ncbi:MAG TPA: hypothetical protein VHB77_05815, partial [Planctomycetaceae bacterium]|nr:hypothetical protein [Planctomycetaceae bacterium]
GAFAVVYKGTYTSGKKAGQDVCVRVFVKRSDERRERYSAISSYLRSRRLECLVGFEYQEKGIRANGKWWPLVTMDWVDGDILFDWCRVQCQYRNQEALSAASEHWVQIVGELQANRVAHGDLQHANVMVTRAGTLKLVDYDCMCVPALEGRRNLELGVEPYQHPSRDELTTLSPEIDNFSALYIFVVLQALAAEPDLWFQYIEPPNGPPYDKLLFRKSDFDDPARSPVYGDLRRSPEPKVRKLVDDLFGLTRLPMAQIPPLANFANDFERVRELIAGQAWEEALALADRNQGVELPADLVKPLKQARERVQTLAQLRDAAKQGDEERLAGLAKSPLLADYPQARELLRFAQQAPQVLECLRELESAQQHKQPRTLVQIWDRRANILANRPSAQRFAAMVADWRERNQLCDEVLQLLNQKPIDGAIHRLHDAWTRLSAKGGHPDAKSREADIRLLFERAAALAKVRQAHGPLGETTDDALLAAWDKRLLGDWDEAADEHCLVREAADRHSICRDLRKLIRASSRPDEAADRAVLTRARDLPRGYATHQDITGELRNASARLNALKQLREAVNREPQSEIDVARAWKQLISVGARDFVEDSRHSRLDLSVARLPLLESLAGISLTGPADRLDQEILAVWTDEHSRLLRESRDAAGWVKAHDVAVERRALLERLSEAVRSGLHDEVCELATSPLLHNYPLDSTTAKDVSDARRCADEMRELLETVRCGRSDRFGELFEQRILRAYERRFAPYQAQIADWMADRVLTLDA